MPSVQRLSAGMPDPFVGEMAQQIGQMSNSIANMIRSIRSNSQAKKQNEILGKFIEYTSIGMPTEQALVKTVQQFVPLGLPGMAGMPTPLQVPTGEIEQSRTVLDPASALTMISKENGGKNAKYTNILNPLVAESVVRDSYGQTRQRSNKFETFVGEDGKTHKGVFDNEGNMIRDMGIAPATSSGTEKSDDDKLLDFYDKRIKGISTYKPSKTEQAKLDFYTKKRDDLMAKQASVLGGEEFQTLADGSMGKKLQEMQDIISDVENTDIEAAARGIGKAGTQNAANISDPNAVINSAYESGVINDEDMTAIGEVLKQDPAKIKDVLAMIKQKREKSIGK